MKYFKTKHEKDSAKITTLIMLIFLLLLFVVGQNYKEQPEEYGVAINFSDSALGGGNVQPDKPEDVEESEEEVKEEVVEEEVVEEEVIEEAKEEEAKEEAKLLEEKAAEEKAIQEIEEAKQEAEAAEKILREEAEEAEKLKSEEEAKQKAEAEAEAEAKEKAAQEAKKAQEAKDAKAAAKAKADAAAKVKATAAAKAAAEAKQKAEAEAKAAADKKAREGTPFALIENAPIYPGCEGGNNAARKQCMSDKIKAFITKNFDTDLASDLTGIQKINISFKIDTSGKVISISAKALDAKLEAEAKRVTRLLPKMKPGMQQGTPVVVSYGLPIRITMQD